MFFSPPISLRHAFFRFQQMKGKQDFLDDAGEFDGEKAYGAILGTFLICSWVEIILAFIKPQVGALVVGSC